MLRVILFRVRQTDTLARTQLLHRISKTLVVEQLNGAACSIANLTYQDETLHDSSATHQNSRLGPRVSLESIPR